MRLRELLREAWRNTNTGTSRPLLLAALLLLSLAVGVVFAGQQIASATVRYEGFRASGAATTIVRAMDSIDASRCAALGEIEGIAGAVALRQHGQGIILAAMPSFAQTHVFAVGDLSAVLGATPPAQPGLLLSESLARQLGTEVGGELALGHGTVTLAGTYPYPGDGRVALLSSAVVEPRTADGTAYDECWVTVWPPRDDFRSLLASAVIASESQNAEFQLLNHTLGQPQTRSDLIAQSNVIWLKVGAAVLALVCGFGWARSRKVEFALALHLGQTRRALSAQVICEASVIAWIVAPAAVLTTVIVQAPRVTTDALERLASETTATALGIIAACYVGVVIALAATSENKISDWAKDR